MSDASNKAQLVRKVVNATYGGIYTNPPKLPEHFPEQSRLKIQNHFAATRENHQKLALELYDKYMSSEQLEVLLDFLTNEPGLSIQKAQAQIQKELAERFAVLDADNRKKTANKATTEATIGAVDYLIKHKNDDSK